MCVWVSFLLCFGNFYLPIYPPPQDDNNLLKKQLKDFQSHLNHVVDGLIRPEEVAARVDELRRKLKSGAGEMR